MSYVNEPGNLVFLTTSLPKLWDRRAGKCLDLGRREEVRVVRSQISPPRGLQSGRISLPSLCILG